MPVAVGLDAATRRLSVLVKLCAAPLPRYKSLTVADQAPERSFRSRNLVDRLSDIWDRKY